MAEKNDVAKIREKLRLKAQVVRRVFSSMDGKRVLQILREELDGPNIVDPLSPHMTHYNLGKRDAMVYIQQLIDHKEDDDVIIQS